MSSRFDNKSCKAWHTIITEVLQTLDEPYYNRQLYYFMWVLMRKYEGIENAKDLMQQMITLAKRKKMYLSSLLSKIFIHMPFKKAKSLIFVILWKIQTNRISYNKQLL
jgi:hypothetical protein